MERYSGARPVGTGDAVITSRHIRHPDNAAAVTALVADLQQTAGGCLAVRRHRFTHEGRRLDNVEAELAGTGLDGVVLVTAHLDSTAARQPGYRPALDPAPGADDDASGTAAVLVATDAITALDAALGTPAGPSGSSCSTPKSTVWSGAWPTPGTRPPSTRRSSRSFSWT